jgi:hypothetical protein
MFLVRLFHSGFWLSPFLTGGGLPSCGTESLQSEIEKQGGLHSLYSHIRGCFSDLCFFLGKLFSIAAGRRYSPAAEVVFRSLLKHSLRTDRVLAESSSSFISTLNIVNNLSPDDAKVVKEAWAPSVEEASGTWELDRQNTFQLVNEMCSIVAHVDDYVADTKQSAWLSKRDSSGAVGTEEWRVEFGRIAQALKDAVVDGVVRRRLADDDQAVVTSSAVLRVMKVLDDKGKLLDTQVKALPLPKAAARTGAH